MAFYVAFYSYKGGVGRSLALANAAYALAARGKKVVLVDMDLEAPGLPEYKEFAIRGKNPKGFVEYAAHYRQTGRCPAIKSHVHACKESPGTGKLWLMPAGAIGGAYQKQLADLSWRKLHPQKGTLPFLETFKKALDEEIQPDYVLIDARTGLSDIGGLSTHQLADLIVLVFNLTHSCLEGSVRTYRSFVSTTSKARFLQLIASPVPSLPPSPDSVVERQLAYAEEHMPLGVAYGRTILRIDYNPAMALSEDLAVRHPEVFPAAERYEALREAIQRLNPEEVFPVLEQARELRSAGRLDDGLALLDAFVKGHPQNTEGHLELGDFLFEAGRYEEAIPAFRTARNLAPSLPRPHRRLGEALVANDKADEALVALKEAEKLGDRGRETYQALARVYAERQETAQEADARRKAILAIFRRTSPEEPEKLSPQQIQELRNTFVETLGRRPPFASFNAGGCWTSVMGSLSLSLEDKLYILRSVLAGKKEPSEISALIQLLQEDAAAWVERLGPSAQEIQNRLAEEAADPTDSHALLELRKSDRSDRALMTYVSLLENPPASRALSFGSTALQPRTADLEEPPWAFQGSSKVIQELLSQARRAAATDKTILITGPIGSGKSHLARYIHHHSPRSQGPLVFVDCGSLSEGDDNTLFGHGAGPFLAATRDLEGRLRQAHRGTLVLDDVERLSQRHQDRLHQLLVDPAANRMDVRLISTIQKNLEAEIDAGRLQKDFASRLLYFELHVPPLRQRLEDIPELATHLLRRNLEDLRSKGFRDGAPLTFDEDCWPALQARTFDDNVRGLDKLIVRLIARVGERSVITPEDIEEVAPVLRHPSGYWFDQPSQLRSVREAAEKRYITEVCRFTNWNLRRASRILGISPKSLYTKLQQYGITRPS